MAKDRWHIAMAAAVVACLGAAATHAWSTPRLNYLTFSGTVALPGVLLPAGTYAFEVLVPSGSADVVRVATRDGQHRFLGLTRRVERPHPARSAPAIVFGEAPAGVPPPINVWYPIGGSAGHQFLYPAAR